MRTCRVDGLLQDYTAVKLAGNFAIVNSYSQADVIRSSLSAFWFWYQILLNPEATTLRLCTAPANSYRRNTEEEGMHCSVVFKGELGGSQKTNSRPLVCSYIAALQQ